MRMRGFLSGIRRVVSYRKDMRESALAAGQFLFTADCTNPDKNKRGGNTSLQYKTTPTDAEYLLRFCYGVLAGKTPRVAFQEVYGDPEYKRLRARDLRKIRQSRKQPPKTPELGKQVWRF